jgi:hypothetical protein
MNTKEELHRAVDEMNDEQLGRILALIENERRAESANRAEGERQTDLSRFNGVLHLKEDPVAYQERSRNEWM